MKRTIWIGWDPREADAFAVARHSIERRLTTPIPVKGVILSDVRQRGWYTRPTSRKEGRLWDDISEAPMATEFAIARFLVPSLAGSGMAVFMDSDMLVRANLCRLFEQIDETKAVSVVKHHFDPPEGMKMDQQIQTRYARKCWSSVMAFNIGHPSNKRLTIDMINTVPGRDLHAFCWLKDDEIGELSSEWNFLVGHSEDVADPKIVHFTDGLPSMAGYENCEFAQEWREELERWAA